jgi:hypothetical protein
VVFSHRDTSSGRILWAAPIRLRKERRITEFEIQSKNLVLPIANIWIDVDTRCVVGAESMGSKLSAMSALLETIAKKAASLLSQIAEDI